MVAVNLEAMEMKKATAGKKLSIFYYRHQN